MGLGTIYLLCFAGVVVFLISGDRDVHHPNNSLINYLDSSRSHALSCINRYRFIMVRSCARIPEAFLTPILMDADALPPAETYEAFAAGLKSCEGLQFNVSQPALIGFDDLKRSQQETLVDAFSYTFTLARILQRLHRETTRSCSRLSWRRPGCSRLNRV